ncbi:hypothetical protein VTN00DRAFT_6910 [Thermoascus crustaceus]|uniref:uncharacterized protein n=1 Tax=Thermoascus crustaceus TaxID=5088 RepID=UPI003742535C
MTKKSTTTRSSATRHSTSSPLTRSARCSPLCAGRVKKVLIAGYSLDARGDRALMPHVLAALSQAELNSRIQAPSLTDGSNIRSLTTPSHIRELAEKAGWRLTEEDGVHHPPELPDGKWEVEVVLSEEYAGRISSEPDERRRRFAESLVGAVRAT